MNSLSAIFSRHGESLNLIKDQYLLSKGEVSSKLYLVKSGQLLISTTSDRGREVAYDLFLPGQIFDVVALFSNAKYVLEARALNESDLVCVSRDFIQKRMHQNIDLALDIAKYLALTLQRQSNKIIELSFYSLKTRLARWMQYLVSIEGQDLTAGTPIEVAASQRTIAALTGVSRETINRQFKRWSDAGMIEVSGGRIRILDRAALLRLSDNN